MEVSITFEIPCPACSYPISRALWVVAQCHSRMSWYRFKNIEMHLTLIQHLMENRNTNRFPCLCHSPTFALQYTNMHATMRQRSPITSPQITEERLGHRSATSFLPLQYHLSLYLASHVVYCNIRKRERCNSKHNGKGEILHTICSRQQPYLFQWQTNIQVLTGPIPPWLSEMTQAPPLDTATTHVLCSFPPTLPPNYSCL